MVIVKYITIFIALLCAIAAAYWGYVRITLGEGGCSIEISWVDENSEIISSVPRSQIHEEGLLLFDFLRSSIDERRMYDSRVSIHNTGKESLLIRNLDVKYVFGGRVLKPRTIRLGWSMYCNRQPCPQSKSEISIDDEISSTSLGENEELIVAYYYDIDTDDPVFDRGELKFTLELERNGESKTISEKTWIKKVTTKYNCLW